jgi:hypothetical protein
MYLHLGNEYSVCIKDIVGIFDIENTTIGKLQRSFLNVRKRKKGVFMPPMICRKALLSL